VVTLWEVQNICYPALLAVLEENEWGASANPATQERVDNLVHLAGQLRIRTPQLELQS
jgi:hypothetical protein